jgi:hypothetical protein
VGGGVVFYLRKSEKTKKGASFDKMDNDGIVVLDPSELATAHSDYLKKDQDYKVLSEALLQKFQFGDYSDNLYNRICILLSATVRNVLYKPPVACDHDSDAGIHVTANIGGIEQQLILPKERIAKFAGTDSKMAFRQMDAEFREIVAAAQRPNDKTRD